MTTIERVIPIEYVELASNVKAKQEEVRESEVLATASKTHTTISALKELADMPITESVDELVFAINKLATEIGEGVCIIDDKHLMKHVAEADNLQEAVHLLKVLNQDNLVGYYTNTDNVAHPLNYVTLLSVMLGTLTRGYEKVLRVAKASELSNIAGFSNKGTVTEDESGRTHY